MSSKISFFLINWILAKLGTEKSIKFSSCTIENWSQKGVIESLSRYIILEFIFYITLIN